MNKNTIIRMTDTEKKQFQLNCIKNDISMSDAIKTFINRFNKNPQETLNLLKSN